MKMSVEMTLFPRLKEIMSDMMQAEAEAQAWKEIAAARLKKFRMTLKASQIVEPDLDYSPEAVKEFMAALREMIAAEQAEAIEWQESAADHESPDCLSESIKLADKPLHRKRPAPDMKLDEDDILDF